MIKNYRNIIEHKENWIKKSPRKRFIMISMFHAAISGANNGYSKYKIFEIINY